MVTGPQIYTCDRISQNHTPKEKQVHIKPVKSTLGHVQVNSVALMSIVWPCPFYYGYVRSRHRGTLGERYIGIVITSSTTPHESLTILQ